MFKSLSNFGRSASSKTWPNDVAELNLLEATGTQIQRLLSEGKVTSSKLVDQFLDQIEKHNKYLKAVIQVTPLDKLHDRANYLDAERGSGRLRGELHGIPILVKDNIGTASSMGLETAAGCYALRGSKRKSNARLVDGLLEAGVIIMGKTNLSELGNYKGSGLPCGWSAVGGQTQSPYVAGGVKASETFGGHSNPGGSSSGSAVAVAAGFCPISIGTESCGSLVMPANRAALYTIKPSVGLVSQHGLVPGSDFCDSAGPIAKTAVDIAHTLQAMIDPQNAFHCPIQGYAAYATGSWNGLRIGAVDPNLWELSRKIGGDDKVFDKQRNDDVMQAYDILKKDDVDFRYPVSLISPKEATVKGKDPLDELMDGHFETIINAYLEALEESPVRSLKEMVDWNLKHKEIELPEGYETQADLVACIDYPWSDADEQRCVNRCHEIAREKGVDQTLQQHKIDIILGPADSALDNITAMAGYPYVTLPFSYYNGTGRPFGLVAIAGRYQEALLIQVMSAWEKTMEGRRLPPKL